MDINRQPRAVGLLAGAALLVVSIGGLAGAGPVTADETAPVTDAAIATAVEDRLFYDAGVSERGIVVSGMNGVITLQGMVGSIGEKERAARLAETVRGVSSVVNRLAVHPVEPVGAVELAAAVEAALLGDPATDAYEVGVTATDDGSVTLAGTVDGFRERDLVLDVAAGVSGVRDVVDKLRVIVEENRSDDEIAAEVRATLAWDRYVMAGLVDVEVDDGAVSLSGSVGSAAEKRRASSLAYVPGVRRVDASRLAVSAWLDDPEVRDKPPAGRTNEEIRKAVERALAQDPRVKDFEIEVAARNAAVVLEGEVDNLQARRSAVQDARNTVGVEYVRDRLRVRSGAEAPEDAAVEQAVADALVRNPLVERSEVAVDAADGVVTLAGMVDTWFEKVQAGQSAARVNGVLVVKNELTVVNAGERLVAEPYADEWEVEAYEWNRPLRVYPSSSDAVILKRVESQLFWSPFVDADQVEVSVDDGIVTLQGVVDSAGERRAATRNALQAGAAWVDNDLAIDFTR